MNHDEKGLETEKGANQNYLERSTLDAQIRIALADCKEAGTLLGVALTFAVATREPVRTIQAAVAKLLAESFIKATMAALVTGRVGMITGHVVRDCDL